MVLLVLDYGHVAHVDVFSRCAIFPLSAAGLHILSLKNYGNFETGFGTDYVGNISHLPEARLRSSNGTVCDHPFRLRRSSVRGTSSSSSYLRLIPRPAALPHSARMV